MNVECINYQAGSASARGVLVYHATIHRPRPIMLLSPNWLGPTDGSIEQAKYLAGHNYVVFIADMYGEGKTAKGRDDALPLARSVRADPAERRRRIEGALKCIVDEAKKRGIGDETRKVAVGFCFGGGNVLELARGGADLDAVICLHGDLATPLPAKAGDIKCPVLVLHGAQDPAVPQKDRHAFEVEMEAARAQWQMMVFSGARHEFTDPASQDYAEVAARQALGMIDRFATDAFAGLYRGK
jgi:dienelactone hydrolase